MDDVIRKYFKAVRKRDLAEPESQDDVKTILDCIRLRNGVLDADDEAMLESSPELLRHKVMLITSDSMEAKASYTKMIASQLYDSPFRFFYEILQNADDATYSKIQEEGGSPSITFHVRSTELIVDLNEDGFSLADVFAICSTGKSSKKSDFETTGEKGYGFKAVFSIASIVHIQSKLWSFSFKHQQHEDGMGMISPTWQQPNLLPAGVQTRITLNYGNADQEMLHAIFAHLKSQPVTIVAFLRRIKTIRILFEDVPVPHESIVFERLTTMTSGYIQLRETVDGRGYLHYFRQCRLGVSQMPEHVARPNQTVAWVSILFPVHNHEHCKPLINPMGQHVFAFLPVRQIPHLPFVIQGDFILPASRQDISDNPWNRKLRDCLVRVFADGVESFTKERTQLLRHQWLQYLPGQYITGFWSPLFEAIRLELTHRKLFMAIDDGPLSTASAIRLLPSIFLHEGQPLLQNRSIAFSYLALDYKSTDHAALSSLGVQQMSTQEMIALIILDASSHYSDLHRSPLESSWHDSFAILLKHVLNDQDPSVRRKSLEKLRQVKIIPVRTDDGYDWRSAIQSPVFFPVLVEEHTDVDDICIVMPTDLGLPVVHPNASASMVRKEIFGILGVQNCPTHTVYSAILKAQGARDHTTASNLLAHFELLFWYQYKASNLENFDYKAWTHADVSYSSRKLCFRSKEKYHAENLVRLQQNWELFNTDFIHSMYQNSQVATRRRGQYSWIGWLERVVGVRWYPQLVPFSMATTLHYMLDYINKTHPEDFLATLQEHWAREYSQSCLVPSIRQTVLNTLVLCRSKQRVKLQDTWFPSSEVLGAVRTYGVDHLLPILDLPTDESSCKIEAWSSISALGISTVCNFDLYMLILKAIATESQINPTVDKMADLYAKIGAVATFEKTKILQDLFEFEKMVWDPSNVLWRSLDECVWRSRIALNCKFVITQSYPEDCVKNLFEDFLGVQSATNDCLLDELEALRDAYRSEDPSVINNRVTMIYQVLMETTNTIEAKRKLRSDFKSNDLIYFNKSWHKSSVCVWHESVTAGDHMPIKEAFPLLQEFFVTILGISTVTDVFMLRQLAKEAENSHKNVDVMKKLMLDTSSLLSHNIDHAKFADSLDKLAVCNFLPCRIPGSTIQFLSFNDWFFLLDDERYTRALGDKLPVLDFTYAQLNNLQNLIQVLGIQDHYLTLHVEYSTEKGTTTRASSLTKCFRECAYAISCCAIFHCSRLYSNHEVTMHKKLVNVAVYTSPDIRTTFSVMLDGNPVEAPAEKAYLILRDEPGCLRIVLPQDKADQTKCLRADLPTALAALLEISRAEAVKQLYRIINELDTGTDQLLQEEGIPHAFEWLSKTQRLPTSSPSHDQQSFGQLQRSFDYYEEFQTESSSIPMNNSSNEASEAHTNRGIIAIPDRRRSAVIPMPAMVDHETDAPLFGKLLENLRGQAVNMKWRTSLQDGALSVTSDTHRMLQDLRAQKGNSDDPRRYSELFGFDEYLNFRVGAAGEFTAFCILKSLLADQFQFENWPSSIRHFARAHPDYAHLPQMTQREVADITYTETHDFDLIRHLHRIPIGDQFADWTPKWLENLATCDHSNNEACSTCGEDTRIVNEWLFEVKTTLGPCETPFLMSESQYSRMHSAASRPISNRRQIYCIIRIYDLLKDSVGVRIFIEAWRFKDTRLQFIGEKWRVRTC